MHLLAVDSTMSEALQTSVDGGFNKEQRHNPAISILIWHCKAQELINKCCLVFGRDVSYSHLGRSLWGG